MKGHYEPYGEEWEKEIMQFSKKAIISFYKRSCISHNILKVRLEELGEELPTV